MAAPEVKSASQITSEAHPNGCLMRLSGVINESFDPSPFRSVIAAVVVLDLDGVRSITSYGVREWISALKELRNSYYCFIRCRPAIVAQFNMVPSFGGTGELLSFYAPYICPSCGKDIQSLIDLRKQYAEVKALAPPYVKCPDCDVEATFDDMPESYFEYPANAAAPKPPPDVDALLGERAATPLKVIKEVHDDVTVIWLLGSLDRSANLKRVGEGLEGIVTIIGAGIRKVTPEGLAKLKELLETPGISIFLEGIPIELANAFVKDKSAVGRASMLSVQMELSCRTCRQVSFVNIGVGQFRSLVGEQTMVLHCPKCQGKLQLEPSSVDLSKLDELPFKAPPPGLKKVLAAVPSREAAQENASGTAVAQTFGRYQLLRPIGSGGMAEVFLARQSGLGGFEKSIVLKKILPNLSADKNFIDMFLQEARVAARISHPNVVQIFDVGQVNGQYYIAMEYVKGWDLNAILKLCSRLKTPFPLEIASRVVADICAGLHAAHASTDDQGKTVSIIHRDVSPHNILISNDGQVKLTDFGIAKAADTRSGTPTAMLKGKLSYMSPEQIRGDPLDGRSDIFPVGLIFFQCLTLEHLFKRDTDFATMRAILHDPIPSIVTRTPTVPKVVDDILDRALARDLQMRYPTARAFQQDLEFLISKGDRPGGIPELAAWLKDLVAQAQTMGELPPELMLTPTGKSPTKSEDLTKSTIRGPIQK